MLGSYTGGFNENDAKMTPFLPSIITVPRSGGGAKTMTWPVSLADDELPGSRVVKTRRARELTVACLVFPQAATEDAVQYWARARSSKARGGRPRGRPRPRDQLRRRAVRRDLQRRGPAQRGSTDTAPGVPWDGGNQELRSIFLGLGSWASARPPPRTVVGGGRACRRRRRPMCGPRAGRSGRL